MTVARGPLDDWQGRKEPRVPEVREATENAASVFLRGPRGNVEQRGAFPWGAHQRDRANARRLWTRDTSAFASSCLTAGSWTPVAVGCARGDVPACRRLHHLSRHRRRRRWSP